MELKLTELNTMNPYDTFDYNSYESQNGENYWEKQKPHETHTKKKKVSFNDILSNMNLVVNNQGVLQFMVPTQQHGSNIEGSNIEGSNIERPQNYNYNSNDNSERNFNQSTFSQSNTRQPQQNKNLQPLEPSVKHSYIYNKYFKDYADPNVEKPEPRVPKTIQEYYQMLLDDKKKAIEHKLRMEQIKSKKLMFTSAPDATGVNPRNIVPTKNNLRSMNFH
jgi:hypothetical protein